MAEYVECWRCGAAKQEPGFPCKNCRVDIPTQQEEAREPDRVRGASPTRSWEDLKKSDYEPRKSGRAFAFSLRQQAAASAMTSARAEIFLTISLILGIVFGLLSFFGAAFGPDSYKDESKAQALTSLIYVFVVIVSYVVVVPIYKYMAVRSREIAERKD